MVEITAVLRDIILIAFIVLLAALAVFGYIRLNKIITKIDSLVENSQKLWSLFGYVVSPIDKINSKAIDFITKSLKSINVDKATKTAKKSTKTATDKIGMFLGPKLVRKLKQTELTENERLKLFAMNMRDASLDILEALRKYLDNLGIEPSKDIFDEIDRFINRKNNKQNSDD